MPLGTVEINWNHNLCRYKSRGCIINENITLSCTLWFKHFTETRTDNEKQFSEKNTSHKLDVTSPPAADKSVKIKDENKMGKRNENK